MSTFNISLCNNFKISKIFFNCTGNKNPDLEFELVKQEENLGFHNLIPESDNYLYMKADKYEKIIAVEGDYLKKFKMKRKDIINKYLYEITKNKIFFLDFIKPLLEMALEKGEAYQFTFKISTEQQNLVCSLYPCYIPDSITSVDIVIRSPQAIKSDRNLPSFIIQSSQNGIILPRLE
jgi:hypothetical protein